MIAEFEEKEYERYFNHHIMVVDHQCWSPGQVLEGRIGYDGAAMVDPLLLFEMFRFRRLRQRDLRLGAKLDSGHINRIFNIIDRKLPPYRFNLFAQHKRPEYISRSDGSEWPSWRRSYFRYKIDTNQNAVLCKLESVCGAASLVTYCCPAFHTLDDLWGHNTSGTLLNNTNYAPPSRLSRHHYYSFIRPGGSGKGHSEEEEINGKSFDEMRLVASDNPGRTASTLVLEAGKAIKEAVAKAEGRSSLVRRIVRDLLEDGQDPTSDGGGERGLAEALAHILALRFAFGTSVMLMGGRDKR